MKIADWTLWERAGDTSKLVKIPSLFRCFRIVSFYSNHVACLAHVDQAADHLSVLCLDARVRRQ